MDGWEGVWMDWDGWMDASMHTQTNGKAGDKCARLCMVGCTDRTMDEWEFGKMHGWDWKIQVLSLSVATVLFCSGFGMPEKEMKLGICAVSYTHLTLPTS